MANPNQIIANFPTVANVDTAGNITGLHTANLTTTANVQLGNIANVHIFGGANGQLIQTDGAGNLSFVNTPATYSNANVANFLPNYRGQMTFSNSNLHVTGGKNGQAILTDGNGNLSFGNVSASINYVTVRTIFTQIYYIGLQRTGVTNAIDIIGDP